MNFPSSLLAIVNKYGLPQPYPSTQWAAGSSPSVIGRYRFANWTNFRSRSQRLAKRSQREATLRLI